LIKMLMKLCSFGGVCFACQNAGNCVFVWTSHVYNE